MAELILIPKSHGKKPVVLKSSDSLMKELASSETNKTFHRIF
jgi:hypothetical protein